MLKEEFDNALVLEVWNTGLVGSLAPLGRGAWRPSLLRNLRALPTML